MYLRSEPTLWTVGFYKPDGTWEPESDHGSAEEAAARVRWLNGGSDDTPGPAAQLGALDGLIVRPGDTLILAFPDRLTHQRVDQLRTEVRERLPDLAGLACVEGVSAIGAYRPDELREADGRTGTAVAEAREIARRRVHLLEPEASQSPGKVLERLCFVLLGMGDADA
jgi:hypothetical protein